jgi:hypothetical protein
MTTAGRVDFPDHMKTVHQDWLNQTGSDTVTSSMVDLMNAAFATNPYTGKTSYDPSTKVTAMDNAVAALNTRVDALSPTTDVIAAFTSARSEVDTNILSTTYLDNDIDAMGDILDDQINNKVLPLFQSGLRDIGASMTSAFRVGEAIILGMRNRDLAKYGTDLYMKMHAQRNDMIGRIADMILQQTIGGIELEKGVTHYAIEAARLGIVAEKEQNDTTTALAVGLGKWPLETYQHGANLLAAIGGGTAIPGSSGGATAATASQGQSALGGALAGAAIGGQVGGGWGAAIGGLLGLGASFL